jgi:hypothetical protein
MTNQTEFQKSLGGSPAGARITRLCTLTLAATLTTGGAAAGYGQAQLAQAPPAQALPAAAKPAKQATEKTPAPNPEQKIIGGYMVHQDIELGGRIVADKSGSEPMWATMVNQVTGLRVLNQYLDMHSVNTSKTPFF